MKLGPSVDVQDPFTRYLDVEGQLNSYWLTVKLRFESEYSPKGRGKDCVMEESFWIEIRGTVGA